MPTEYTSTKIAEMLGLTVSSIQRKAQRVRCHEPCGKLKYGRWIYDKKDIEKLKIDYRKKDENNS